MGYYTMQDILTLVYTFADTITKSRIRRVSRRLSKLPDLPVTKYTLLNEVQYRVGKALHREDGPAVIYRDCYQYPYTGESKMIWYFRGRKHNSHGPALIKYKRMYDDEGIEHAELYECKEWWVDGYLHRVDGPAVEEPGIKKWYYMGKLHRTNGPAVIKSTGSKYWYIDNQLHREDGPAIIYANGDHYWYYRDMQHRIDGAAVERIDGSREWWLWGKFQESSDI